MKQRASALFAIRSHSHVFVRSIGYGGYWGRGKDLKEAIKNSEWIGSQDKVFVFQCDETAKCDEIDGSVTSKSRGPIYLGKVMRSMDDVLVTEVRDPNPRSATVEDES